MCSAEDAMTDMPDDVQRKLGTLRRWFRQWDSVLVAYSGGVDSSLLMAVAGEELGPRALSCIGVSPSYPRRERDAAVELAERCGARVRLVTTEEHLDDRYRANDGDRCYHCKSALFRRLRGIAGDEGFSVIVDGNNLDDLSDDRPGQRAAREQGVRSPLIELELTKQDVRELARTLDIQVWDKPAMACLSSRVPQGTPVTPELLSRIEAAEDVLHGLGFRQFRVRHAGDTARIELLPEDLARAVELRGAIVEGVRKAGYRYACLDLAGFRGTPPAERP
jgi:uncharacterized protein